MWTKTTYMCVCLRVLSSIKLFCDPMDCFAIPWTTKILWTWNFSRQEYWSGLPFPIL